MYIFTSTSLRRLGKFYLILFLIIFTFNINMFNIINCIYLIVLKMEQSKFLCYFISNNNNILIFFGFLTSKTLLISSRNDK